MFSWNSLPFSRSNECWQFDLWFLCLFQTELINLEVLKHVLLKPSLKDFEHSMWNEYKCMVFWTFFDIALLWHCNENWHCPILWPSLNFQICWHIEGSTLTASSFRVWNSSTGIPSPPLALFMVVFPKVHLTSDSRVSGSRWVITPSWLPGSWRSFCTVLLCSLTTSS